MNENEIKFLPYEQAVQIVAAIQEEEDIHRANRRILTVYNHDDKELCWFDYQELINDVCPGMKKPDKEKVQDYILHHIPDWALDI